MKRGENNFVDYLLDRAQEIRRLAENCTDKNWHFGYKSSLKFMVNTYVALRFPPRQNVVDIIGAERLKIRKELGEQKEKTIARRMRGCLQGFDDVLDEIKKGELIA